MIRFSLVFLFFTTTSIAQNKNKCSCFVKGIVKDQETNQPIAGAVITLQEIQTKVISDSTGRYAIYKICEGSYTLKTKILGYKPINQSIQVGHNGHEEDLVLDEEAIHLTDVEIKAKRIQTPLSQSVKSLQGQSLLQTRGQSLAASLKEITGVSVLQTANIEKPVIHGMHSNRLLILNNGVRQEGQQWGSEHAPEIDPFMAQSITVVKGAASMQYGSEAVAGVVVVEPDALPTQGGIGGSLTAVGISNGRGGTMSGTVEGGLKSLNGFGWRLQGTMKRTGDLQTPHYFLNNTGIYEKNMSAAMAYRKPDVGGFELFFSRFNTKIGIFSGVHFETIDEFKDIIEKGEPAERHDFSYDIGSSYQTVVHNLMKAKGFLKFGGHRFNLVVAQQKNQRSEFDLEEPQPVVEPELAFKLNTISADFSWEHAPIAKVLTGQLGVNYLTQHNEIAGRPLIPNFNQYNLGAYWIERIVKIKWELEAGLRYDNRKTDVFDAQKYNFNNLSASFGAVYRPLNTLSFRFNMASAWRPPNMIELYSDGIHHGAATYEKGDNNLQKEVSKNLTFGGVYKTEKLAVEIEVFKHWFNNFIYLQPKNQAVITQYGAYPAFNYQQTNATFEGLDIETQWSLARRLTHTAKLSYLKVFDTKNQQFLNMIPANRLENSLRYDLNKSKGTFLTLTHLWVGQQKRVSPNADFTPPPAAYHLWNVQGQKSWQINEKQRFTMTFMIENLFDSSYRDYLDRFRYFALNTGRNVSVVVNYEF